MTLVTVMRDRYVRGWPRHDEGEIAEVLALEEALERDYESDAHFAAYRSANGRRLVREAIDLLDGIELTCIVFDVDGPGHSAGEPWRRALREKVQALAEVHPAPYFYETRGGARIVYRQETPTVLRSQADAKEWSRVYAVAVAHLARRFGIEADPACCDWQRLYRLPRATREPVGRPENWPTLGDASAIGALLIEASPEDVDTAKRASRAFREPRARVVASIRTNGDGLLYHLIRARGDVVKDAPRGGWIVRCPNRAEHTVDTNGTDSTVLYPPDQGEIGFLHCLHAHCAHLAVKDWLRLFSDAELETARRAAGIVRAA